MLICLPLISCFYLIVKAFFRHDETLESLFLCLAKHYSRKINIILYFWFYFIHRKVYKQYKLIFHFVLSTRSTFSYDDQYLQIKIGQNNEFIAHCSHSLTVMRSSFSKSFVLLAWLPSWICLSNFERISKLFFAS